MENIQRRKVLRKYGKQAARQTERINGFSKDNEDKQKISAIWKNYVWNMEDGGVDTIPDQNLEWYL